MYILFIFFFFQAEDGIRDVAVTGVQTCALPICFSVMNRVAALRSAAVGNTWAVVLIVGVADREFAIERMIDSEEPRPHMDLVVVVRSPAKTVHGQSIPIRIGDQGSHERSERTQQRISCRNDVSPIGDRKSTRLNSSHGYISYAVFCLRKKQPRTAWPLD